MLLSIAVTECNQQPMQSIATEVLREKLRLYLVTDDRGRSPAELEEICMAAIAGGVTSIQLREKSAPPEIALEAFDRLGRLCRSNEVLLVMNADLISALLMDSYVVQFGKRTLQDAAHLPKVWGYSAHSAAEAVEVTGSGASFVTVSPIYATVSKPGITGAGTTLITDTRAALPAAIIVALGGISAHNAHDTVKAGADGVAVMSAIMSAGRPDAAARELRNEIDRALHG